MDRIERSARVADLSTAGDRSSSTWTLDSFRSMSPREFESAITLLLDSLGFKTKQTRLTADGGIDIWATDERPIIGGRVIVQCKKYAPDVSVGEPAVRELYGLVHAHGVSKGVVVTTSHFTAGASTFAKGKPIELIDGRALMSLVAMIRKEAFGILAGRGERRHFQEFELVL